MRITCPSCGHQFEVDPVMVSGRTFRVRCSKCETRTEVDHRTGQVVGPAASVSRGDTAEARRTGPVTTRPLPRPPAPRARVEDARPAAPAKPSPTPEEVEVFRAQLDTAHRDMMGLDPLELFGVGIDADSAAIMTVYTELREHWRPGKWTEHLPDPERVKVRELADRIDQAFNDLADLGRRRRARASAAPSPGAFGVDAVREPPTRSVPGRAAEPKSEAEIFYARGKEAFNGRRYAEAKEAFEQCVSLEPESAQFIFKLAEATLRHVSLDERPDYDVAKVHYDRALELEPENLDFLIGYGQYLKARGEVQKAMRYFKQVRDLEPKHHEANREIRLYLARKRKGAEPNTTTGKIMKLLTKKL